MSRGPTLLEGDVDAVLHALRTAPASRRALLAFLQAHHRNIGDSAMRIAIESARAAGQPIVHNGERYKLAQSREEYEAWERKELTPRLTRLSEERAAMRRTIAVTYPEQLSLIA